MTMFMAGLVIGIICGLVMSYGSLEQTSRENVSSWIDGYNLGREHEREQTK